MAPIVSNSLSPRKRPISMADADAHQSKKQRRPYHHHHALRFKHQGPFGSEPTLFAQRKLSEEAVTSPDQGPRPVGRSQVDDFLDHSIISLCEEVAKRDGIADSTIDTWALETFRGCVEEYILDLCKYIRRPMIAARRTAPIASDFESAFQAARVPSPADQLPRRCAPKIPSPSSSLMTPPPNDGFLSNKELQESILVSSPSTNDSRGARGPYIPTNFPAFPSKHTFQNTAILPRRETDARRIRELATEEGRLGEEALRKLATAGRGEGKLDLSLEADPGRPEHAKWGVRRKTTEETVGGIFEQTMKELARAEKLANLGDGIQDGQDGDFEMAPIVNSERKFWMPDTSRRTVAPKVDQAGKVGAETREALSQLGSRTAKNGS